MKRANYLFLLVPSLFLITSCQTTPKVDTIDEKEAQAFIKEHYNKELKDFKVPSEGTKFRWEITDNKDQTGIDVAKATIKTYLGTNEDIELKKDNVTVALEQRQKYLDALKDLVPSSFDDPCGDAIIGMNWEHIYKKLFEESTQSHGNYDLIYKKGPDNGLVIISQSNSSKVTHIRTHTYDHEGFESKFEVVEYRPDVKMQYKLTIDFTY